MDPDPLNPTSLALTLQNAQNNCENAARFGFNLRTTFQCTCTLEPTVANADLFRFCGPCRPVRSAPVANHACMLAVHLRLVAIGLLWPTDKGESEGGALFRLCLCIFFLSFLSFFHSFLGHDTVATRNVLRILVASAVVHYWFSNRAIWFCGVCGMFLNGTEFVTLPQFKLASWRFIWLEKKFMLLVLENDHSWRVSQHHGAPHTPCPFFLVPVRIACLWLLAIRYQSDVVLMHVFFLFLPFSSYFFLFLPFSFVQGAASRPGRCG